MSLSSYLALTVRIDWNNDGDFTDTYEDVSTYVLYPVRTSRGRASVTDEFSAGTGSLRLYNADGRFSPFNTSSPIYPNVLPGRPIQITATYDGVTYPVFRGRATPVAQGVAAADPYVELELIDGFEELRLGLTRTPISVSQRVDEVITEILDDINWPFILRNLDESIARLRYFTNHNRLPINALQLAARHELGGRLFIAKDGSMTFRNRYTPGEAPAVAVLSGTFDQLDPQVRQEDLVNTVRVEYPRMQLASTVSELWSLSLPLPVPANSTIEVDFLVSGTGIIGATYYTTPLVAGVDFEANSAEDGSGTSKNAQVTVEIPEAEPDPMALSLTAGASGGGTLVITNSDSSTVYLTMLKVSGKELRQGEEINAVTKTVSSPILTGQQFTQQFEFPLTTPETFTGYATYLAAARGSVRARPTLTLQADTDALMVTLLDLELGDKLELTDTGAAWLTQIDNVFIVEHIDLEITGPRAVRSTLKLFDRELAGAGFFRMSGAAGTGQDYSQIVSAVSTTGDGFAY